MIARRCLLGIVMLSLLAVTSCQPDILLRLITRVYHDGSLDRRMELRGWTDEGDVPVEDDWFAEKARMQLAQPEAWNRITRGPGRIDAEGFFTSVDELPAVLQFSIDEDREKTDRIKTSLEIDERVVIKRWRYTETHGDPHSREDAERALSALTELAVEALESELRRHFGQEFDTTPAAEFMRDRGRSLFAALLAADRRTSSLEDAKRFELQKQVLAQHGAPLAQVEDADGFWDLEMLLLFEWSRALVAESLSSPDHPVAPADLSFWPVGEDIAEMGNEIIERVWGSDEVLWELAEPHFDSLTGYYTGGDTPGFRFEVAVELPGRLLSTNGTPDGSGARWLFRDEDLGLSDTFLRVETVEPLAEPLTLLGARREFSTDQLIQLADLLWRRDPQGIIAERLQLAVERGSLGILLEGEDVPEGYTPRLRELTDLLDPDVEID
jgi:hypothetical protein